MKYKFTADRTQKFNKYGVDLTVYGENVGRPGPKSRTSFAIINTT